MAFKREKHHRRSIRLPGYDYGAAGGYFVTVCSAHRKAVFGKIDNSLMKLNVYGQIVEEEWSRTAVLRTKLELDEFVVMPNHFHGIIILRPNLSLETQHTAPQGGATANNVAPDSLSSIVRAFKSAVTRRINAYRAAHGLGQVTVWQRNYYERIIRDEPELNETRRYIIENPLNWETDENYM